MGDVIQRRRVLVSAKSRSVLLLLILVILGLCGWRIFFYRSDIDKGLAHLRQAYKGQRPTESRTTAGFDYAPLANLRGDNSVLADQTAHATAARLLIDAALNSEDARARHGLGLLYLAEGKTDDAIREFKRAIELAPDDPALNSDLGAAYLERAGKAESAQNGEEFLVNGNSALKHIDRALALNSGQLEALFNKALVLDKMTLSSSSMKAWNTYFGRDPSSPWTTEAKEKFTRARENKYAARTNPQVLADFLDAFHRGDRPRAWEVVSQTRELVSDVMVQTQLAVELLTAHEQGTKERVREISDAFTFLGKLEKEKAGDELSLQVADHYRNADETTLRSDLAAHRAWREGHHFMLLNKFKEALERLETAKGLFLEAGNTFESGLAEYDISYCLYVADRIAESNQRLTVLSEHSRQKGYVWLRSMSEGWLGSNFAALGEFSKAIDSNNRALDLARGSSDSYNIQRSLLQLSDQYRALNNSEQALKAVYESLTYPAAYHTFQRQRQRNLFFATRVSYRFKLYEVSSEYALAVTDMAENQLNDIWMQHLGLTQLGAIYSELGKYEEATASTEKGLKIAGSLEDEGLRNRRTIESLLTLARILRQSGDCPGALDNYSEALRIQENVEAVANKYEALRGQFQCQIAIKDEEAINDSMPQVLQFLDANREKIKQESDRNAFFDNEQDVYDSAIGYFYSARKAPETAFDYAETSRSRSLLNLITPGTEPSPPLSHAEIRSRMPADVQMIYYAVLSDRIVIWYLSGAKTFVTETAIGPGDLEAKVSAYRESLRTAPVDESKAAAKEFYDLLIKPVESMLEKGKPICIVADKSLFRIPFAALVSPGDSYLIQDFPLLQAPSASIFIRETEGAALKNVNEESVLSIGDPEFSAAANPGLSDLPDAKREAEEVAALYRSAKLLTGKNATKASVSEGLENADVVNFAGHYVPNIKTPALSKLVLVDDLPMQEIMDRKLGRVRLMVLSACETGAERLYNGEGMIGSARAFMAADVPVVVATQWPIDSASAARLMTKFHFYRKKQGQNTSSALRSAQLDMLREPGSRFSSPFYWAGFTTIGGYSTY